MASISNSGQASYKSDLEGFFDTLQEQRADVLASVRELQLAARQLAVAEARRLAQDVGPDDPRVALYTAGSAAILRRTAALDVELQIAQIRVPPVTKTETLLQGRITDETAMGTAQATVTLVDAQGRAVEAVAPVQTDDAGYYAFVLTPAQVDAIGSDRSLTLQIGSDSGRLVPAAAKPFTLAAGKVTVAETRLNPGELGQLRLRLVGGGLAPGVVAAPAAAAPARKTKAPPAPKKP